MVTHSFGPFFFAVVLDIILYGEVITLAVLYLNSSPRYASTSWSVPTIFTLNGLIIHAETHDG